MDKILLGYEWSPETGRTGAAVTHDLARGHATLIAPTGSGKGVSFEIFNGLCGLRETSWLSLDPSGQNAAVCAEARSRMGHDVLMLNPFNLHVGLYPDMADLGSNPLLMLDAKEPEFELAASFADALIAVDGDTQKFFPEGARGLMTWLMMFVRLAEGDNANLGTVRDLLTGDLSAVAREAADCGNPTIASLAYKYIDPSRSTLELVSTAEVQTRSLLSKEIRASLGKNGIGDFGRLKDRLTSLFVILPAGIELETHGIWFKLIVTCALNALYRRASGDGVPVLFLLSEFAQMQKLPVIRAAFGQARKYNLRILPVLQNYGQLVETWGQPGAGTFIANSSAVIGLTPADPDTAAWMENFSGRQLTASVTATDDPQHGGSRINVGTQRESVWSADRIRELPEFHGLVWKAGHSRPQPVFLPPYWEDDECRAVARPDPYHPKMPPLKAPRRAFRRAAARLLAAVGIVAALWWLPPAWRQEGAAFRARLCMMLWSGQPRLCERPAPPVFHHHQARS